MVRLGGGEPIDARRTLFWIPLNYKYVISHIYVQGYNMPNMTLALPEDVYQIVKTHAEVRWSEIARRAIADYAKKLAMLDALTADSELTEEDIMKLDEKIKDGIFKHYKQRKEKRPEKKAA